MYCQIRQNTENSKSTSRYITVEKQGNRVTKRTVEVFHDLTGISREWVGLESLIKVETIGTREGKPYHQVAYYISSKVYSAIDFAKGIHGHWGIENRLHWGGSERCGRVSRLEATAVQGCNF
ncbi:MAG: ISAs1 family transposase [Nostoc sp.]